MSKDLIENYVEPSSGRPPVLAEAAIANGSTLVALHAAWLDAIFAPLGVAPTKYMGKGVGVARGSGNFRAYGRAERKAAFMVQLSSMGGAYLELAVRGDLIWAGSTRSNYSVSYQLRGMVKPFATGGNGKYTELDFDVPFTVNDTSAAVAKRVRKEIDALLKKWGVGVGT